MVGSKNNPDNYRALNIGAIIIDPQMLLFTP